MSSIIKDYIRAGYPLLWVETHEEYRAMAVMCHEMSSLKDEYNTYAWDIVAGVHKVSIEDGVMHSGDSIEKTSIDDQEKPAELAALEWLDKAAPDNTVLYLKDYHNYVGKNSKMPAIVSRKIRNLVPKFKACGKSLVIVSAIKDIPVEIEKEITVVPFKLPDRAELKIVLKGVCDACGAKYPKDNDEVIDASLGMTSFEAENAYSVSLIKSKKFDPMVIRREKASIVRKGGQLEVVDSKETLDDIGGLTHLKDWLISRKKCFTAEARDFGVVPPRGLILVGIPGCGKSLSAKAVASAWGRPLLRLDVGKIMGSYVGESEANLRRCLQIAEAVAPCVLWIDELEKSFSGTGAGDSDGHGTTKRVFQEFLTWMQERTADVFIVATANAVTALPPELLNRFEKSFWVDIPEAKQREEIIRIHLGKRGRKPAILGNKMKEVVAASEGFNGREIEAWIKEALVHAFNNGHDDLKPEDLLETAKDVTPVIRLMKEDIVDRRSWADKHGIKNASKAEEKKEEKTKRKIQA